MNFEIAGREIGPGAPCFIIGEVAQAHDGSLGMAHAFIDAIADAGADAVKFQTHIAAEESSQLEPWRVKFSLQDETRFEYWQRMEFTSSQWAGLARHARERGLVFLSSPFSEAAVDLLNQLDMPAWKVASGETNNPILLEKMAATGRPILLSTGMSPMKEIDEVVAWIKAQNLPLAVFQCTSRYPSPPETIGLNMLPVFRQRYDVPVGLSDHSAQIYAGLAAATLGANLLEVHVTLSREAFGPDVVASLTTAELHQLVEGVRFIEQTLAHPVDKDANAAEMEKMRRTFGKALVALRDLPSGHILTRDDLTARKPASAGIPVSERDQMLGRALRRSVRAGSFIRAEDVERA